MIALTTPAGLPVMVPETEAEDCSPRFTVSDMAAAQAYYQDNGYVIFSALIDPGACERVRALWNTEVKGSDRFLYRQSSARSERNVLNGQGWVMNPILNLQSINPYWFGGLRDQATRTILCADRLRDVFTALLGAPPKIVQSMYFEGNEGTSEHQDSYYLDSEHAGTMAAAWVALEDIGARAGRFFLCPGSHRLEMDRQNRDTNIASRHDVYLQAVVDLIRDRALEIRAPLLRAGDVLIWNAWTVHGSLPGDDPERSRSSITTHAIPVGDRFMQFQTRLIDVPTEDVNGTQVWRTKDQARLKNRLVMLLESRFPVLFYALKRMAIRLLVR